MRHVHARPEQAPPPNTLTEKHPLFADAGRHAAVLWLVGAPLSMGEFRDVRFSALISGDHTLDIHYARRKTFNEAFALEIAHSIAHQSLVEVAKSNSDGLHHGDSIRSIYAGRTGTVVKVYPDGSASVCWDDGEPQPEGLAHERMPRALLEIIASASRSA
jgi:hypothetical protein